MARTHLKQPRKPFLFPSPGQSGIIFFLFYFCFISVNNCLIMMNQQKLKSLILLFQLLLQKESLHIFSSYQLHPHQPVFFGTVLTDGPGARTSKVEEVKGLSQADQVTFGQSEASLALFLYLNTKPTTQYINQNTYIQNINGLWHQSSSLTLGNRGFHAITCSISSLDINDLHKNSTLCILRLWDI